MGWNASLTAGSTVGSSVTYTPDTSTGKAYTVGMFTAPKKGVYRFMLYGSGGVLTYVDEAGASCSPGGSGGTTVGYLLLDAYQTVYVGCGGPSSAAFVSSASGISLAAIAPGNLYFVAGGGGGGGSNWGSLWNMKSSAGGVGGGATGGTNADGTATGGTQSGGGSGQRAGSYGTGAASQYYNDGNSANGGCGGDGLYGGAGGGYAAGGGGGSGYVYASTLTVGGNTYAASTAQGGGAASNTNGFVVVTFYAEAELPVVFNGVTLQKIIFNGTELGSLIFNGTVIYFRNLLRRWRGCLRLMETAFS